MRPAPFSASPAHSAWLAPLRFSVPSPPFPPSPPPRVPLASPESILPLSPWAGATCATPARTSGSTLCCPRKRSRPTTPSGRAPRRAGRLRTSTCSIAYTTSTLTKGAGRQPAVASCRAPAPPDDTLAAWPRCYCIPLKLLLKGAKRSKARRCRRGVVGGTKHYWSLTLTLTLYFLIHSLPTLTYITASSSLTRRGCPME